MNAERLHAVAIAIREDLATTNAESTLSSLISAVNTLVSQPQPQYQEQVSVLRQTLREALTAAPSNNFGPLWSEAVKELAIDDALGNRLRDQIDAIFADNQMTPAVASTELQKLQSRLTQVSSAITQLIKSFTELKIGAEVLAPGECEVGVLIPREFVDNKLHELGEEFAKLDELLAPFAELATGTREGFRVRAIASSDFNVFVETALNVAACIASAMERLVALYKNLIEIRKLQNEMKKRVPEKHLEGVTTFADGVMADGVSKIAVEIVNEYSITDDKGRKNELTTAVRISLHQLAGRLDRGFNIEVRAAPPAAEEAGGVDDGAGAARRVPAQEYYARITVASSEMKFLKTEGEPILKLPSAEPKGGQDETP